MSDVFVTPPGFQMPFLTGYIANPVVVPAGTPTNWITTPSLENGIWEVSITAHVLLAAASAAVQFIQLSVDPASVANFSLLDIDVTIGSYDLMPIQSAVNAGGKSLKLDSLILVTGPGSLNFRAFSPVATQVGPNISGFHLKKIG